VRLPEGYTVRPATDGDLDAMTVVANSYDVADFGRPDTAREHLADGFRVPGFDAERDTWLVLDRRGHAAAFGMVGMERTAVLEGFGRVHPDHGGRGLGAYVVGAMEERASELARSEGLDLLVHNGVSSTDATARRMLDDRGYRPVRFFWHMERSLHRSDLKIDRNGPAPLVRRAEGSDEELAARAALDEAFLGHWGVEPWGLEDWREHLAVTSGSVLVAIDGHEVAGAITFMPTSNAGWVEELGVREAWRGRGLGALLLRHAFAGLEELGMREVRLNVDADNATGATQLYERVGMHVRREWIVFEKSLPTG
jgi:mycothiol synthase